ncbi:hypothetical protein K443DRAFT_71178, partial [Laccaria amethystina LaAM-08-1]
LNGCLCGMVADSQSEGVLECKRLGCETQWYHLHCVSLEVTPCNWVCEACEVSGKGIEGRSDHKDDVILPYMEVCLI